jgi:catechol 2,3-dioxygenase-like lactoylglutathione lyase family enzyme
MSEAPTYKFDHVHLYCSDLAASERWFLEGMGAELVRRRVVKNTPATDLRLGGVSILLRGAWSEENLGPAGQSRFGTDHFGLLVENLEATAQELKRRGVEFEVEPYEISPGTHIAFVQGPDALRIEIVQRD